MNKTRKTEPVKFLLVDDREDNLLTLEALLERDGLDILKAHSGDEALELLLTHDVALAFLDVQMPEMDGFALAELMRGSERSRHVPIIFVTASPEEQHRLFRGYDAGAVDFLFKPLEPRVVRHKADTFFRLFKQRQELAETLRLNETFVAAVGHDLKNPLGAISMAAELLRAKATDDETRRIVDRLRSSSRRMSQMIDDLFDLARARLDSGIPIERANVDLVTVVRKVVSEQEATTPGREIIVHHAGDGTGDWDGTRLAQVVSNLVGNALRHGSPDAPVRVELEDGGNQVCLSVQNGGAINPSLLPHIFDPFRSSEDKRARSEGLGLGLYIVRQIVIAHGGRIEVRSNEAEGTTFQVWLPRKSTSQRT